MALFIFDEFVTPAELTGYARAALADRPENQPQLAQWLPYQTVDDLTYRFTRNIGGLTEAAAYRAWDSEPRFGRREGIARVSGELPPLGRQMLLNEYDQLKLRNATAEVRSLLLRDARRLALQINARLEIARADALVNGSVTIAEEGVEASVDFDRSASHRVTATTLWSDPNADPITDMDTWMETYNDSNGTMPGSILTSTRVARILRRNAALQGQVFPGNTNRRLTQADVDAYLADQGWPPITTYDAKFRVGGADVRAISDDLLLLLPGPVAKNGDNDMGATLLGTTLESQEADYGIGEGEMPGLVVGAFKNSTTPIQVITIAAAIGIPILANPDLSFVADVL